MTLQDKYAQLLFKYNISPCWTKQYIKHATILMKRTENLSSSSLFYLYFWQWAGPFIRRFWGWLLNYLFRCCDADRNPISQSRVGITLWATSLLVFRLCSFEKFNFCIRGSLCQAKIYQGIPKRQKFRIISQKVSTSSIYYSLLVYLCFPQYVAYLSCCQHHNAILLLLSYLSCRICLPLFYPIPICLSIFFFVFCKLFKCINFSTGVLKTIPSISFLGSSGSMALNYLRNSQVKMNQYLQDSPGRRHKCSSEDRWDNNNAESFAKHCYWNLLHSSIG